MEDLPRFVPMIWRPPLSRLCSSGRLDLDPAEIEDVVFGCAFPEGEQGMNMARMIALRAGLPDTVPAETINRYCSSGVQSIAHVAYMIKAGDIEVGIGGGVESMSMVPMMGYKFSPNPHFAHGLAALLHQHGTHRRERLGEVWHQPRRPGCVCVARAT